MGMDSFRSRLKSGTILLSLALAAAVGLLEAQPPTGEIRLEIKDPSGAPVTASGTLRNPAGGAGQPFQADALGTYRFANLPYGRYQLEISKAGFSTVTLSIDVRSATPASRTVTMALAGVASKVHVVAAT